MKPKQLGDGDVSLGLIVVDWDKKEVNWEGMDGNGEPMTAQQLLDRMTELDEAAKQGNTNHYAALLFWHDENQLTCHDSAGVVNELFKDDDNEDD